MLSAGSGEILFYAGIGTMCVSAAAFIASQLHFLRLRRGLKRKLDAEYGEGQR